MEFREFSDHEALESIGKVGDDNPRVQWWLEFLTAFDYTPDYRKGSADGKADYLSRLSKPATEHARSWSSSLTPAEGGNTFLMRACGLVTHSSPTPGVGLGGLVPRLDSAVFGGLPFTSSDWRDFGAHGPRMRIDDISAPSGTFVVRVSVSVTTVDRRPGRGENPRTPNTDYSSVFDVPSEGSTGSVKSPRCRDNCRPAFSPLAQRCTGCRFRRDHGSGRVCPCATWQPCASDCNAAFGPHFHPDAPTKSPAASPVPTVPIPSDHGRAEPAGTPL